jgi:hypothetical protein
MKGQQFVPIETAKFGRHPLQGLVVDQSAILSRDDKNLELTFLEVYLFV